jgi:hypothetical protein
MRAMDITKNFERRVRGWLPKEPKLAYAPKPSNPRWRKPRWIAFTLISIIALSSMAFLGIRTYMRYSDPRLDVTASYFGKSLNCSAASVDDVVEVKVSVYWHGYVIPEFKRQVEIIDPYPESNFQLVGGNNTYTYSGYGGGDQFTYLLEVTGADAGSIELPKPRLYLDNTEIPVTGTNIVLDLQTASQREG